MNYFLVNAVSKRRTKMARKAGPAPQRYSQRFLGGSVRLTRGRHHPLTQEQLEAHWDELKAKCEAGACEVRVGTPMGALFDFGTLDTKPEEPEAHEEPKVEPKEAVDAPPEPEEPDDAPEAEPEPEVESPEEAPAEDEPEEAPDFASMTNKQLVDIILEHSDDWSERELKKMKKAELLELLG